MSASYYPAFSPDPDWWDRNICGEFIALEMKRLDKICKKHKVKNLCHFSSTSRDDYIRNVLHGNPDDPASFEAADVQPEHWFSPEKGLKTVRLLLEYAEEHPTKFINPEGVVEDLEVLEITLSRAMQEGLLWHLATRV